MRWNTVCVIALAFFVSIVLAGCNRQDGPANSVRELRVLCGSSMSAPAQEIGGAFSDERHVEVLYDFGGSETLLPKILAGAPADLFICHDPFEQKVKESGKWAGSAVVGALRPVLMVRPGNPRGIHSLEDLAKMDVQIGIGDPRYSTCGEMFVQLLDKKGIRQQVMDHVKLQGRTHAEIANGAILGPLDAVVVWNFVAVMYKGKLDVVETGDSFQDVNVTVVGLTSSPNPAMRDAFLDMCRSEQTKETFRKHGYTPSAKP